MDDLKLHIEDDREWRREIKQELKEIRADQRKMLVEMASFKIKMGFIGTAASFFVTIVLSFLGKKL